MSRIEHESLTTASSSEAARLIEGIRSRWTAARRGARMYEAVMARADLSLGGAGPRPADLARFRDDELRHAATVGEAMLDLGVEPPAPACDVEALAREQALADPRTTLGQVLRVLLEAEVAEINAWEALIATARRLGQADLARQARRAALEQELHVVHVRHWMAELAMRGVA
jgi:hypothetical protein